MAFSIKINRLGPIRDSEISLSQFMIFTGQSNTGKSYAAFAFYAATRLFTDRNDEITDFLDNEIDEQLKNAKENSTINILISGQKIESLLNVAIPKYIGYLVGNPKIKSDIACSISIKNFEYSIIKTREKIQSEIATDLYKLSQNEKPVELERLKNNILKNICNSIFQCQLFQSILLPPARAAMVGLSFSAYEKYSNIGMYRDYLMNMDFLERIVKIGKESLPPDELKYAFHKIADGNFHKKEDELFFNYHGVEIPLIAASSAIKEMYPIYLYSCEFFPRLLHFVIEEPEAHLHPELQIQVADILSSIVAHGGLLHITTHSDYLLSRMSLLVKLFNLKEKSPAQFNKACKELNVKPYVALNPQKVGAYYFEKRNDGSVQVQRVDIENGIPMDSFKTAFSRMVDDDYVIGKYIQD